MDEAMILLVMKNGNVIPYVNYEYLGNSFVLLYGKEEKSYMVSRVGSPDTKMDRIYDTANGPLVYETMRKYGESVEIVEEFQNVEDMMNSQHVLSVKEDISVCACAEEIKKNSSNVYIKESIEAMIRNSIAAADEECYEEYGYIYPVMKYLANSDFDYTGFGLVEIPHPMVFCFGNEEKQEYFDLIVSEKEDEIVISPAYVCDSEERLAESIQEAIKEYKNDICTG